MRSDPYLHRISAMLFLLLEWRHAASSGRQYHMSFLLAQR